MGWIAYRADTIRNDTIRNPQRERLVGMAPPVNGSQVKGYGLRAIIGRSFRHVRAKKIGASFFQIRKSRMRS